MIGSYILLMRISKNIQVKIGALGKIPFCKGLYAYIGSAMNNIERVFITIFSPFTQ